MSFSRKTNCDECGYPLHVQDLSSSKWAGCIQEFLFICSSCGKENLVVSHLFDKSGHVRKSYLSILKDDNEHLPSDLLIQVKQHLEECEECRSKFNDEYLNDIEEKVQFNDKSYSYFLKNSKEVNLETDIEFEDNSIKSFVYEGEKYSIFEEDEFFRVSSEVQEIAYYLKNDCCLIGMVKFLISGEKVALNRIWFRSKEVLKREQQFFQDLKDGKVKLKLSTVKRLFKTDSIF